MKMTTIEEIDGTLCILGYITNVQSYYDGDYDLYTQGYCPVCDKIIVCDFNKGAPNWIFNNELPTTGTFEVDIDPYSLVECPVNCLYYRHRFIVSYTGTGIKRDEYKTIYHVFNQIVPFRSSVTELLLEQAVLLRWYEQEFSNIVGTNISFPDVSDYLKKILSWDNSWKCEFFYQFAKKTCGDVSKNILSFIDWLTYEPSLMYESDF